MNKFCLLLAVCVASQASVGAWYWPFGSDDEKKPPRVSELMEPASLLIEEAADLADTGKYSDAVETYKRALAELERIEFENSDRAQTPAFATLRNKRAYVNAAIDSLHLQQAKENARAVAVTDTTELEKKFAQTKQGKPASEKKATAEKKPVSAATKKAASAETSARQQIQALLTKNPTDRRARLLLATEDLKAKDYAAALLTLEALLEERPNDAAVLNLRAAVEAATGDFKKAERTLDQSIRSSPRQYYAYYNMARLFVQSRGGAGKAAAKRYYETGRSFGGPVDSKLEAFIQ